MPQVPRPRRGTSPSLPSGADARDAGERLSTARLDLALTIRQADERFFGRFGGSPETLCGRAFGELVHPGFQQALSGQFAGLVEGRRERFVTDIATVGPDGASRTVALTAVLVRGGAADEASIMVMLPGTGTERAEPAPEAADGPDGRMLSPVHARILEGIAAGLSTVPLADRLHLSRQGVDYHVASLLRKLQVPNRAALVSRAYAMGALRAGAWPPEVVRDFVRD
ncbi:helix-turn-helix transcriptional regulator [Streptomyces paludis]|uniref:Helix-turn-helix transcriptional regulator n=1 Tax=Streptomyces paludis TaxID=2282738 RepID=A0A345HZR1_9ACTN|nr:LuxR C-terminal-related transcriptional regulator [Streptomyces paludis]AXG82185.1 helix-turn-helix transcriptional regulator [Streptomyces paludis]